MPRKVIILIASLLFLLAIASPVLPVRAADSMKLNVPIGALSAVDVSGNGLGLYFSAWYKFLTGAVGIMATIMIMYGGFKWLTSRGGGDVGQAKDIIFSALLGLVLALLSYIILNTINPQLLNITMPSFANITGGGTYNPAEMAIGQGLPGSHGNLSAGSGTGGSKTDCPPVSSICSEQDSASGNHILDYSNTPKLNQIPAINNYSTQFASAAQNFGLNANGQNGQALLAAIASAENAKGDPAAVSSAGADGLMQIMPNTATGIVNSPAYADYFHKNYSAQMTDGQITSDELTDPKNTQLSIDIAAAYVRNEQNSGLQPAEIFAGYNGGAGAVSPSSNDPNVGCGQGVPAYRCCTQPGCLTQTQDYVSRTTGYYESYGGK